MNKKKYYIFSLVLLFGMLFAIFSTCYARTTLTDDEAEYLYNYIFKQDYNTNSAYNFYYYPDANYGKSSVYSSGLTAFKNIFNSTNDYDIDRNKTIFYSFIRRFSSTSYSLYLYYGNFNNGKNDNLPHFYFYYDNNSTSTVKIFALDDDKNAVHYPIKCMRFNISSDAISLNTYYEPSLSDDFSSSSALSWFKIANWNLNNLNQGNSLLEQIGGIISFSSTNAIYTNYDGSFFYNTPITKLLQSSYVNSDSPVNPDDPTIPEDTGNTGTITDNNGDTTGQIDLSGIQNGIGNINQSINNQGQAIIDNQNSNTQTIIDNQNQIAQQQHEDLTSYDEVVADDGVNNLISNIQGTLSGDLSNSEIFGALENTEQGFLNLITGQASDFEVHWSDVYYNNVKLIPAGQVNFSAICRDNATLGNIKEKLNIILSALCGLALIKYLYNLLLATLGIDNPYLYDSNTDNDYIKTVDKNTGVTTFSGIDKDGTRWRYTYNSKASKGGKRK